MHIAFIDSNPVGLGALRAAKRAGHHVTFISSNRFAAFIGGIEAVQNAQHSDQVVQIDSSLDEDELFSALSAVSRERRLDAVVTVLDFCTHVVARCAKRLGLPGTDPDAVALAQDKAACRARIAARGIRSVPFALVDNLPDAKARVAEMGYPVIAKPKRGAASLLTAKIETPEELEAYFATLHRSLAVPQGVVETLSPETLVEGYVDGPLFSVEMAAANGEFQPMALSWRKRCIVDPSVELGTTMPAPVSESTSKALVDYALTVVRSLDLDLGIFHIELIVGPDGPVLVEVNPRIMGGNIPTVFRLATGVDPFELLIGIHLSGQLPDACRTVATVRSASTRSIGPASEGRIPEVLPAGWTAPFEAQLSAWNVNLPPGALVGAMDSTYCPNHFQLVRDSSIESSLLAEWIISVTAQATGLNLRQSREDYLGL